jgi:hypothetical protein
VRRVRVRVSWQSEANSPGVSEGISIPRGGRGKGPRPTLLNAFTSGRGAADRLASTPLSTSRRDGQLGHFLRGNAIKQAFPAATADNDMQATRTLVTGVRRFKPSATQPGARGRQLSTPPPAEHQAPASQPELGRHNLPIGGMFGSYQISIDSESPCLLHRRHHRPGWIIPGGAPCRNLNPRKHALTQNRMRRRP